MESDVAQTSPSTFWFPLKLRHSSSGPFHDTGARYSFLPASTSPSAVPSSGKAKASRPVSGSGAPPLPSEKPQAQRLPHPDGLTGFPHAFALFSELPRPLCRNGNCPSPHLQFGNPFPFPGKAYSSAGAQTAPHHASTANKRHFIVRNPGVRFQANIREQPGRSFSLLFSQSSFPAECFRCRYCLRPFLAAPRFGVFPGSFGGVPARLLRLAFRFSGSVFSGIFPFPRREFKTYFPRLCIEDQISVKRTLGTLRNEPLHQIGFSFRQNLQYLVQRDFTSQDSPGNGDGGMFLSKGQGRNFSRPWPFPSHHALPCPEWRRKPLSRLPSTPAASSSSRAGK